MKAIIFDLDGTLTDSGEGIINCAALALSHYGIPIPPLEQMRTFVGPPLRDTFIRFGVPADKAEEAIEIYRSRYIPTGMFENRPYDGIRELLQSLCGLGYPLYVATSKPEEMSVTILEHFDLARYFTRICGATMDESRSTKSDVIAYLKSLCTDVDAAVMVGDTHYDVEGAAFHGIPTIGVSWGYGSVADMERSGAIAIAHTPEELFNLLTT